MAGFRRRSDCEELEKCFAALLPSIELLVDFNGAGDDDEEEDDEEEDNDDDDDDEEDGLFFLALI